MRNPKQLFKNFGLKEWVLQEGYVWKWFINAQAIWWEMITIDLPPQNKPAQENY